MLYPNLYTTMYQLNLFHPQVIVKTMNLRLPAIPIRHYQHHSHCKNQPQKKGGKSEAKKGGDGDEKNISKRNKDDDKNLSEKNQQSLCQKSEH